MITLKESQFIKEIERQTKDKTPFETGKTFYYINKIFISFIVLSLSAYFSFNFHVKIWGAYQIFNPEIIGIFSTVLVSALIWYVTNQLRLLYLSKGQINEYLLLITLALLGGNIYADLKGVKEISKAKITRPEDTKTNRTDQTHTSTLQTLDNQEKAILKKYVLPSNRGKGLNFLRGAYIPTTGNKWHSRKSVKEDREQLKDINQARAAALRNYSEQRTLNAQEHKDNIELYNIDLNEMLFNFRFGSVLCSLVFIISIVLQIRFEKKVIETSKYTTPEETPVYAEVSATATTPQRETGNEEETKKVISSSESTDQTVLKLMLNGNDRAAIIEELGISKGQVTKSLQKEFIKGLNNIHDNIEIEKQFNTFRILDQNNKDFINRAREKQLIKLNGHAKN